jgi:ferredoxin--NADP+ reductase
MDGLKKVSVVENQPIGNQALILRLNNNPDFEPGQIIALTIDLLVEPRLYSICSAPGSSYLEILYTVKPDGILSPKLAQLQKGDWVYISEPSGQFIMKDHDAWWIATGTGIAPFYSMFRSGIKPLKLIQGGRTKDDLFFRDKFIGQIAYVGCCSRDSGDHIFQGRLTKYLEGLDQMPTDIYYYLCGSAEMVVDVRNLLISKGILYEYIITEIYF